MGKNDAIRVTVRFRPRNRREENEENNTMCVKITPCGRACQLTNPLHPDRPKNYSFDTIYGPDSQQGEVYRYSGLPLVEAMKEGYNSTIFAYGQTGSGKTWSMMGALGTENRGIQPRIIEDTYDFIENQPADNEDSFVVEISMCEIYMERIKDLLNPSQENLPIRQSPKDGIYVDGIVEQYCASAQEVLDTMEAGFMNRATSATKMNPESSRSHCVTILKVTRTKPNGAQTIAKIKMVDLAGSEKTSKTEATGQRLKEAQNINQSLTALSQVLKALTKPDVGFVPYRNSKLTRLLQDALGGNSKTSLIVAASPCSFNVEETISSLGFGERAKKVTCKAVINAVLSVDEYKKELSRLTKENEALTYDNELMRAREAALADFLDGKGYDAKDIVKDVKHPQDKDNKEMDFGNLEFEEVNSAVYEIDKKTGRVMAGNAESLMGGTASGRARAAEAERKRKEAEEREKLALMAAALIRRGDYAGLGEVLHGKVSIGGGMSSQAQMDLEDQLADLKAEIRGADSLNDQLDDELEAVMDQNQDLKHDMEALRAKLAEHRFYKQKVAFLEKESEMQMRRMRDQDTFAERDVTIAPVDVDLSFLDNAPAGPWLEQTRTKLERLTAAVQKRDKMIGNLKDNATVNFDELIDSLSGSDGQKAAALKKLLEAQKTSQIKVRQAEESTQKARRQAIMLTKRDEYHKQLQGNWQKQLKQMEQAVMLCSQIHKRDRASFKEQIKARDEQITKLKAYLMKQSELRARQPGVNIAGKRVQMPSRNRRSPKSTMRKKRRPSRAVQSVNDMRAQAVTA